MKEAWHKVLRDKHKQDYLLSKYGVAEPSQRQPVRNKKEIQK